MMYYSVSEGTVTEINPCTGDRDGADNEYVTVLAESPEQARAVAELWDADWIEVGNVTCPLCHQTHVAAEAAKAPLDNTLLRVGVRLRQARRMHNMTQVELAAKTGIGQAKIARYERGEMDMGVARLIAIMRAVGAGPEILAGL